MTTCKICGGKVSPIFSATILAKHSITYFYCESCGFLSTEDPYWLQEAYTSAIASSDTGLVNRNVLISRKISAILFFAFGERGAGKWLDYAGGYGMLTRMMRDRGYDFFWDDMHTKNIFSQGFEHKKGDFYSGVTAIEVLEHTLDPLNFLSDLLKLSATKTVIFTTEICPSPPPDPKSWWYFGLNTGQHISFFQERTLKYMAKILGVHYFRVSQDIHIFTSKKLSLMNLRVISGRLSHLADALVKKKLKSKMIVDHQHIVDALAVDGR